MRFIGTYRVISAVLLGAVAFALTLIITDPPGPGLDPDALAYVGAAESLAAHGEYRIPTAKWTSADSTEPLAHFPPGYSTALALPLRLGMMPTQSARLIQATAAFVTVVLLVSTATSTLAGILLVVALFSMTSMHEVHVSVLSEPMFLACLALVLAAMVWTPDRPLRAAIPAAIGVMTRYAGISLVGAVAVWSLIQRGPWRERLRRAVIGTLPGLVLPSLWALRTRALVGKGGIRKLALYGNVRPSLEQGGATLTAWLVPDPGALIDPIPHRAGLAIAAGCALAALVAIGAFWSWREVRGVRVEVGEEGGTRANIAWRLISASALITVCYLGVVVASRLFADPDIPFDERIFAPALLLLMTMAATALTVWWRRTRLLIARIAVGGALLAWWCAAASATFAEARYALERGSDFADEQWRRSELLAWAGSDGTRAPLYSNWPSVVFFYLHRPARGLPKERDARTLAAFADTVRVRGGRVLLFDVETPDYAPNDSLTHTPGLRLVARVRDGVVLRSAP